LPKMSRIHPRNHTPVLAVFAVGGTTALALFLGEAGLVPILEVGAVACAVGWMSACASYFQMRPSLLDRAAAAFGVLVTSLMILVKVLPIVPGHFTRYEWIALGIWGVLGLLVRIPARSRTSGAAEALVESPGASA